MRVYLDRKWTFFEQFDDSMIHAPSTGGKVVDIPHTVKETPLSYFDEHIYQMICCYQKRFVAPNQWSEKDVFITFEGVGHESDVYVNGVKVAHHECGYTAFTANITEALRFGGENLISICVNTNENINQPPFGYVIDYMTYGGIYRDVYFEIKDKIHIKDVFYKPALLERVSTVKRGKRQIEKIKTQGILKSECVISREAYELSLKEKLFVKQFLEDDLLFTQPATGVEKTEDGYKMMLTSAPLTIRLWDVESPTTYVAKTQLICDGKVVDEFSSTVGFRNIDFNKDGFFLNGRKLKIRGLNRHQSYPYVGYAMPESMQRFDAKLLKDELGVNAVRTSHYPQSHFFIDECDKQGLLVFTEMPGWQHIGDEDWKNKAVQNVSDMIHQYRNHPSIFLWGVRINESPDDDEFYKRTNEVAKAADPTRFTGGVRCIANSHLFEDVYTYNDFSHSGANKGCQDKDDVTSDESKAYLISEFNGHMFPTKSYDAEEHRREHAIRYANVLNGVNEHGNIAGSFGWCMFDYNTHKDFGSGDRICYHGVMDMFRNPKFAASIYAAEGLEEPVLELSTSFDIGEHPACNRGETYIISNADSVRMYKNDVLIKEYVPSDSAFKHLKHGPILIDDYIGNAIHDSGEFKKGTANLIKYCCNQVATNGLKITPSLAWAAFRLVVFKHVSPSQAVPLYNKYVGDWGGESKQYRFDAVKDGEVVKSTTLCAMTKVNIKASASHTLLCEQHTYDVAEIRIKAVDENDNQLYFYNEPLCIETEGPIEVVGPSLISLKGGMTGIYIKSLGEDGDGKVKISGNGFEPVEISVCVNVFNN